MTKRIPVGNIEIYWETSCKTMTPSGMVLLSLYNLLLTWPLSWPPVKLWMDEGRRGMENNGAHNNNLVLPMKIWLPQNTKLEFHKTRLWILHNTNLNFTIQFCIESVKFAFCGIQACIKRITLLYSISLWIPPQTIRRFNWTNYMPNRSSLYCLKNYWLP